MIRRTQLAVLLLAALLAGRPVEAVDLVDEDRAPLRLFAQQGDQLGAVGEGRSAGQADLDLVLQLAGGQATTQDLAGRGIRCPTPLPGRDGDALRQLCGRPAVIVSGSVHYPRVPRPYWRDRIRKAKAMGFNCIGTYVFWNAHEKKPGVFDFSGNLDIAAFADGHIRGYSVTAEIFANMAEARQITYTAWDQIFTLGLAPVEQMKTVCRQVQELQS